MAKLPATLTRRVRGIIVTGALIAGLATVPAYATEGFPETGAKCDFYDNGRYYACTIDNGGGLCTDVTSEGKILSGTCIRNSDGEVIGVSGWS